MMLTLTKHSDDMNYDIKFIQVFRPLANESLKCENNTKPDGAVLPVLTSYSCLNQGGFSFTKRACINPTPDTTLPTLLTTYRSVASLNVTLPSIGRYFVPLNEQDRADVRRGDLLALIPKSAAIVRRSTADQELSPVNGRLTGDGILEYDGVTSVPGEHQWRALVVLPSRIWVRNTNVGMWDTSWVNVTLTNPLGENKMSALAPAPYPGIEIVTPLYGEFSFHFAFYLSLYCLYLYTCIHRLIKLMLEQYIAVHLRKM